jgi:hypothetical protein
MNPKNYVLVCVDFIRLYNSRPTNDWGPNQSRPSAREASEQGLVAAAHRPPPQVQPSPTIPQARQRHQAAHHYQRRSIERLLQPLEHLSNKSLME